MPLFQGTQWYDVDQFRQHGIPQLGDRVKFYRKRGTFIYTVGLITRFPATGMTFDQNIFPRIFYWYLCDKSR